MGITLFSTVILCTLVHCTSVDKEFGIDIMVNCCVHFLCVGCRTLHFYAVCTLVLCEIVECKMSKVKCRVHSVKCSVELVLMSIFLY